MNGVYKMKSLDELETLLKTKCSLDERIITGIWSTDCLYNPPMNGRVFKYKFIIVQTGCGQGCAYYTDQSYDPEYLENFIGQDCLNDKIKDIALKVACLDSLAGRVSYGLKFKELELNGNSYCKLHARTDLILEEAFNLLGDLHNRKVINIGVVGDIIKGLLNAGCDVIGSDYDNAIIGKKLFNKAEIFSGNRTLELLKGVDLAIVTGMTITTHTIDAIIDKCKECNVKLIVYAETGANMGQYYVKRGVNVYLGEMYPFYIFNGISTIVVTKSEGSNA